MVSETHKGTMFSFYHIIIVLIFVIGGTEAQGGGITDAGDSYVCVPAGFCGNGGTSGTSGIDPRIVTPGSENCPSGQVPCYTQGPSSNCGVRYVRISTADGPVTNGAYPWQAYIRNSTHRVYAGSGALIDNYHILTAAHKVYGDRFSPSAVTVLMGVTNPNNLANVQNRTASQIVVHRNFDRVTLKNDIAAIIRVRRPFNLSGSTINSLCLPEANNSTRSAGSYIGQPCVVAGWGQTKFQERNAPNPMKQVNLSPIDISTCRSGLLSVLSTVDRYLDQTGGEICAGGQIDKDVCTYDGGAPLTCQRVGKSTMVGLVIWGKGCGQANVYGVYVSVPHYRRWIDTTITELNG